MNLTRRHQARAVLCAIALTLACLSVSCNEQPLPAQREGSTGNSPEANPDGRSGTIGNVSGGSRAAGSSAPPVLVALPEFRLEDQSGAVFGSRELRGTVWVADFIFTRCRATCPLQTTRFADYQREIGRWPEKDQVKLVSFTVDPEHDTSERLRDYAKQYHADDSRWKFLTGDREALWRLSKDGFKLPVAENSAEASSPIMHSDQFVLVDGALRIRGFYESNDTYALRKLLRDMRSVLAERGAEDDAPINVALPPELFYAPWLARRQAEQHSAADDWEVLHDFSFTDRLEESGIRFVNRAVADAARNWKMNHYDHANGLAAADVDGDGLVDLYFLSQVGGNELWRNIGGGHFENLTAQAGVALKGRVSVSASFADTDNDGDADLFVTTTRHGNAFFENDGRGRFRDVTRDAGLEYVGHSSTGEFFDYDRDGLVDLLVTNVGRFTTDEIGYSGDPARKEDPYYVGMKEAFAAHLFPQNAERNILFRNEGSNRFRNVFRETGLDYDGWSGEATPIDINGDGWQDLYVVNMQGNDECFENLQGRAFRRVGTLAFDRLPWGAMDVKSLDFNNDGLMDLFAVNMHADMWERKESGPGEKLKAPKGAMPESYLKSLDPDRNVFGNVFFLNEGTGKFREVSDSINAENYWPWGLSTGDLNADGFTDAFITSCMNLQFRYHPNTLLINDRGQRFVDAEFVLGVEPRRDERIATPWFELDCCCADAEHELCKGRSQRTVVWGAIGSRASVLFDIDGDGDLDIVTNDFNSPPMVLVSDLAQTHADLSYLKVALRGTRSNRDGLGAKVQVTFGETTLTQVNDGQSGYLSQSQLPLYFGLAAAKSIDRVTVEWPSGHKQTIEGPLERNQTLLIEEPPAAAVPPSRE